MDNELFQQLVLNKLEELSTGQKELQENYKTLSAGQEELQENQNAFSAGQKQLVAGQLRLENEVAEVKQDVKEIRKELRFVWEGIKKLDNRLSTQEGEIVFLERLK